MKHEQSQIAAHAAETGWRSYLIPANRLNVATGSMRLALGTGTDAAGQDWHVDINPARTVADIIAGRVKHLVAKRYIGPVEDRTAPSGYRHADEESRVEVLGYESHVTGDVTIRLRPIGKSA